MARFAIRRVGQMLVVLFAVSVLTFLIFNVLPAGDPALRMAGRQPDPGQLERIRDEWGFDEPLYVQYAETMKQVFSGELDLVLNAAERLGRGQGPHPAHVRPRDRRGDPVDGRRYCLRPLHRDEGREGAATGS